MKYIKTYEENIDSPQIGDYVITYFQQQAPANIENVVGKIINVDISPSGNLIYDIEYMWINNKEVGNGRITLSHQKEDMIYWSKNKEDCEAYLSANKYNL